MTDDELRVAILGKMGWHSSCGGVIWEDGRGNVANEAQLPDPLTDLNAMHEAEKVLTRGIQRTKYNGWLDSMTNTPGQDAISATARQRAEAFCRTLWPERFKH